MVRRNVDACRPEIFHVTDHAGRPARILWLRSPTEVLLPLASICFYFIHQNLDLNDFDFWKFRNDVLHNAEDSLQLRVDIFLIPGGTDAECVEHYHKEVKSRGDVLEQIREVQEACKDFYNNHGYVHEERKKGKLPGLFTSRLGESTGYHSLIFVFKKATWNLKEDDKKLDMVQFDPKLILEEFGPGERIPILEPIKTTRVRTKQARREKLHYDSDSVQRRSEDEAAWWWFENRRDSRLWTGAVEARNIATSLGWTAW